MKKWPKLRSKVSYPHQITQGSPLSNPVSKSHNKILSYLPRINSFKSAETVSVRRWCSLSPDRHEIRQKRKWLVGRGVVSGSLHRWTERSALTFHGGTPVWHHGQVVGAKKKKKKVLALLETKLRELLELYAPSDVSRFQTHRFCSKSLRQLIGIPFVSTKFILKEISPLWINPPPDSMFFLHQYW